MDKTPCNLDAISERSLTFMTKMLDLIGTPEEAIIDDLIAELNPAELAEIDEALEHLRKRISLYRLNKKITEVGQRAAAKVVSGWAAMIGNARRGI